MRNTWYAMSWALASCLWSAAATAQEGFAPPKPGKEHELLRKDVGTWEAKISSWGDPSGAPEVSRGIETNTLMPGGLWLISSFEGEMAGMKFHGHGQNGYDTARKKYVATWVDSMTTAPMLMEGTYDEGTRSLTMEGETTDPAGNKARMKIVSTSRDDGTRVATFFMKPPGGADETKFMEIEYKRKGD